MFRLKSLSERLYFQQFIPSYFVSILYDPGFLIHFAQWRQIRIIAKSVSGSILDFGCGSKPYESLFGKADKYLGIDTDSSGHNHSKSKVDVYYDGHLLPFVDAEFDHVVMFDVLEHLDNPDISLDEIFRILKPGGLLIGTVPFNYPLHEKPNDYLRYTEFGVESFFSGKGFKKFFNIRVLQGYSSIIQSLIACHFEGGKGKSQKVKRLLLSPILFFMNLLGVLLLPFKKPNSVYTSNCFVFKKC